MEKGSISVYFVKSAIAPVVAQGGDADALLRKAGIAPALLKFSHGRVSAQHFSALWLGVAACLDDELFGQDARRMKVGSFAMLARTLVHCDDLRVALHTMARFLNLILDDFHCTLTVDAGRAGLTITQRPDAGAPRVMGHETLLMMMHGLACWLIGRRIPIVEASFAYPEPAASAEYPRMYCERLRFDQAATVLSFDAACLDQKVVQDLRSARQFIAGAPANIVLKYRNSGGLAAQIRRRLRAAARTEWPDFDHIAGSLHMTPSTLRRRLLDEGQSFQSIKDQLRRDMAIHALCHTSKSVSDISNDLGFAEASAFHRAFKKWTGGRPGEYRQRMHGAAG